MKKTIDDAEGYGCKYCVLYNMCYFEVCDKEA